MEEKITPLQTLFIWRLLVEFEGVFIGKANPKLSPAQRNQLVVSGLIEVSKRKNPATCRKADFASLTEKGWSWAERNLDSPLPTRGTAALTVLQRFFEALSRKIEAGELSLAGIFSTTEPSKISNAVPHPEESSPVADLLPSLPTTLFANESSDVVNNLKSRVYDACFHLSGDQLYGVRIRLADLRSELADIPRPELDRALQDLERNEEAALMPLDDPREICPMDEEASLANSHGTHRHILYLSRPRG